MPAKVGCVLVVEDESMLTEFMADFVHETLHFNVVTVSSNRNALKCLQFERPDFAILDYQVGDGTIKPTLVRLLEMQVPFFVVSGFSKCSAIGEIFTDVDWLEKPFSEVEFAAKLNQCLKKMVLPGSPDPRGLENSFGDECPSCNLI